MNRVTLSPHDERLRHGGVAFATAQPGPATSRQALPLEQWQGDLPLGVPGEGIRSRDAVHERKGTVGALRIAAHRHASDEMSADC